MFEINVDKKYDVVYVQCHNVENARCHVENECDYRNTHYIKSHKISFEHFQCGDALIFDACKNNFFFPDFDTKTLDFFDMNHFIENFFATELCNCYDFECKSTIYILSDLPLEKQMVQTVEYVNRVLVENSSNLFDESTIENYFDSLPNDKYFQYKRNMKHFFEYRHDYYTHLSARYETK